MKAQTPTVFALEVLLAGPDHRPEEGDAGVSLLAEQAGPEEHTVGGNATARRSEVGEGYGRARISELIGEGRPDVADLDVVGPYADLACDVRTQNKVFNA